MKLRECRTISEAGLPRIDNASLEPLWISDFYDGPLSGAVIHEGQFAWFTLAEEESEPYSEGWYRRYWIVRLTPVQQDEERRWHDLFRTHVGTHWDFQTDGSLPRQVKPREQHQAFYEPYSKRKPLVLDDNDVIGWFQF